MNISRLFFTMAQTTEISQPTLFPFPMSMYLVFCIIATVFFIFRFVKEKQPYQIIMAVAVPLSILIGYSDGKTIFYSVGIVEAVLLLSAFVSSVICNRKKKVENSEELHTESKEEK
ncbi:MAG: hypothetical protein K2J39_04745 [Ruminococcus sp.]|nr:hypothetical protein [Ruminococcus sp.]